MHEPVEPLEPVNRIWIEPFFGETVHDNSKPNRLNRTDPCYEPVEPPEPVEPAHPSPPHQITK